MFTMSRHRRLWPSMISTAVERELNLLLSEDSTNAFAPVARQNLAALSHNKMVRAAGNGGSQQATTLVASLQPQTFPTASGCRHS